MCCHLPATFPGHYLFQHDNEPPYRSAVGSYFPQPGCEPQLADRPVSAMYEKTILIAPSLFHSNAGGVFAQSLMSALRLVRRLGLRLFQLGLSLGEKVLELFASLRCQFGNRVSHDDSTLDQFFGKGTENGPNP